MDGDFFLLFGGPDSPFPPPSLPEPNFDLAAVLVLVLAVDVLIVVVEVVEELIIFVAAAPEVVLLFTLLHAPI